MFIYVYIKYFSFCFPLTPPHKKKGPVPGKFGAKILIEHIVNYQEHWSIEGFIWMLFLKKNCINI